jgi:serine/threonine protein phosphatase PrpC
MRNLAMFEKGEIGDFKYKIVGLSMTGVSHIKNGIENQDSFGFHMNSDGIAIGVADGVGSCMKAKSGSTHAIETINTLHDNIENGQIRAYANSKIKDFIISGWKSRLDGALIDYSTTLKFAIISSSYILIGGIVTVRFLFRLIMRSIY